MTSIRFVLCGSILVFLFLYYSLLNFKKKTSDFEAKIDGFSLNLNLVNSVLGESKETLRQLNQTLDTIVKLLKFPKRDSNNITAHYTNTIEFKDQYLQPNIKIFDLNKPLEPIIRYSPINCRTSANLYDINTTLCIHDIKRDIHVRYKSWTF